MKKIETILIGKKKTINKKNCLKPQKNEKEKEMNRHLNIFSERLKPVNNYINYK